MIKSDVINGILLKSVFLLTRQYLHYHAHWIFWLSKVSGCNQICIRRICSDQPQRSMVSQIDKEARLGSQRIFPRPSDPKDLWEKHPWLRFYIVLDCVFLCWVVLCCVHCLVPDCVVLHYMYYGLLGHWLCSVLHCVECGHCGSGFSLFWIECCGVVCSAVLCCLVLGCCSSGFRHSVWYFIVFCWDTGSGLRCSVLYRLEVYVFQKSNCFSPGLSSNSHFIP